MVNTELIALVDRLRSERGEREWLEFKRNRYEPRELGEYLSALANSAARKRKPMGYLVFGIRDTTHDVVGTSFDPYNAKAKGNQDLLIWLNTGLNPNPGFDVEVVDHPQGRIRNIGGRGHSSRWVLADLEFDRASEEDGE